MKKEEKQELIRALAAHREGLRESMLSAIEARPFGAVAAAFGVGTLLGTVGSVRLVGDTIRTLLLSYGLPEGG
jgi:hypothetical protein